MKAITYAHEQHSNNYSGCDGLRHGFEGTVIKSGLDKREMVRGNASIMDRRECDGNLFREECLIAEEVSDLDLRGGVIKGYGSECFDKKRGYVLEMREIRNGTWRGYQV